MNKFSIQTTGKEKIESEFGINQPCQYMLSQTRHYSWPKGAGKLLRSIVVHDDY